MSRALRSGAPRLLRRHDGAPGRWYDAQFRALAERFGPFDAFTRQYAGLVAAAWVGYRQATERLADATRTRQEGRGRRPNLATIRALEKRVGLAQSSYDAALRRLEELSAKRPPLSPMAAFAREPELS